MDDHQTVRWTRWGGPWACLIAAPALIGPSLAASSPAPGDMAVDGPGTAARAAHRLAVPMARPRDADPHMTPQGWLVSEKFDGVRALWDGRGLFTRGGLPLQAPDWFVAQLPALPLDGELWLGRQRFDELSALLRRQDPSDARWREVRFMVFEAPTLGGSFAQRVDGLRAQASTHEALVWQVAPQERLPDASALQQRLDAIVAQGGEGLVLHRADAPVVDGRTGLVLKLKPVQDADAVVVGYQGGHGRLQGLVGALKVRDEQGRHFLIGSGLSDAQRRAPPPLGTTVSYRWRGQTRHGLPRFATLWRVRDAGQ